MPDTAHHYRHAVLLFMLGIASLAYPITQVFRFTNLVPILRIVLPLSLFAYCLCAGSADYAFVADAKALLESNLNRHLCIISSVPVLSFHNNRYGICRSAGRLATWA
jgi:hypothetical protein